MCKESDFKTFSRLLERLIPFMQLLIKMYLIHILFFIYFLLVFLYVEINYKANIYLLFFVASYGINQLNLLYKMMKEFVIICESGYKIKVVVHHTAIINNSHFKNFYCFNERSFIKLILIKKEKTLGHYLVREHRKFIIENKNMVRKYDHIAFFENDIEFTLSNLQYYFYTLSLIKRYNIHNAMPGFKRYELSKCNNGDIWKSCQDHIDNVTLFIIGNKPFIRIEEGYTAMWILPIEKLLPHIYEEDFINIPPKAHKGNIRLKEWYTYNSWEMHFLPMIPLSRVDDCFVHHLSNKYIHYYKTIQISELYYQLNICRAEKGYIYKGELINKVIFINRNNINRNECIEIPNC